MSTWHDVETAQSEADKARADVNRYGSKLEGAVGSPMARAVLLAADAICLQLRTLCVVIDYNGSALCRATGRE